VPKNNVQTNTWNHVPAARNLALSRPPIWARFSASLRHRRSPFLTSKHAPFHAVPRGLRKSSRSGTPCTPPGSSTGCGRCARAAFEPSRHILLSDSRGSITGIRAWSANPVEGAGHRQDIVLPVFLVCTISHPPARTSSARPAVRPVAQNLFVITTAHSSAASPWRSPARRHPARWRSDHRRRRCHRATSHASPRRAFGRPPRAPWHGI
jgi:hypothetical protein